MLFHDWRDTRAALDLACEEVDGAKPDSHDPREWKIVDAAIKHYRAAQAFNCVECKQPIGFGTEIRCLDCKSTLCERCAPRHFWPNGHPTKAHGAN